MTLLDLLEARVALRLVEHGVHLDGLLAGQVAGGVQAVDADVRQRAAAGISLLPPGTVPMLKRRRR